MKIIMAMFALTVFASSLAASPIEILEVRAERSSDGSWHFHIELDHADTGWDHYANRWEVWDAEGDVEFGERVLYHPHVNDMPFTRSQSGIKIPDGTSAVLIRAFDNLSETQVQGEKFFELPD